jgi:FMN phosphatase YigB (HAD superfamily)
VIKNIIFDLGNVLVKVDLEKFRKDILSIGVDERKYADFLNSNVFRSSIYEYETGSISTKEFVDCSIYSLGCGLSRKLFIKYFNEMLVEKKDMKQFVGRLTGKGKYTYLLLSNTNPLHWEFTQKNFPYVMALRNFELSYKLKLYKPDIKVYEIVLRKYRFIPEETLYVDDHLDNCAAAQLLGIKTINFVDYKDFEKEFRIHLREK